jgi:hypothetical protein
MMPQNSVGMKNLFVKGAESWEVMIHICYPFELLSLSEIGTSPIFCRGQVKMLIFSKYLQPVGGNLENISDRVSVGCQTKKSQD